MTCELAAVASRRGLLMTAGASLRYADYAAVKGTVAYTKEELLSIHLPLRHVL